MAIYITGDTHGDFKRFLPSNFPEGDKLTRSDTVIVAGDFGLLWDTNYSEREMWTTYSLSNLPFTIAFICGNHENHARLQKLHKIEMFGAQVGKVAENIFYLRRGEVYTIEGKKFFTFGGALSRDIILYGEIPWKKLSHIPFEEAYLKDLPEASVIKKYGYNIVPPKYLDKNTFDTKVLHHINDGRRTVVLRIIEGVSDVLACRIPNISWWSKEVASAKEMQYGLDNLKKHDNTMDYIVSHVTSKSILDIYAKQVLKSSKGFVGLDKNVDPTEAYMDQVYAQTSFKQAYSGHMHDNWDYQKHHLLFDKIVKIA
jgi:hypothetical protein